MHPNDERFNPAREFGVAAGGAPAYLAAMRPLARFSPLRPLRDLRAYLASRQPYELWFMIAALLLTAGVLFAFVKDSAVVPVYRPNIIYVQQWRADRTDAEIRAQQVIDQVKRDKEAAELKKRERELQQQYKRLDDRLKKYGI